MELLSDKTDVQLTSWQTAKSISKMGIYLQISQCPLQCGWEFWLLCINAICYGHNSSPVLLSVWWYWIEVSICISLKTNNDLLLVMCYLHICMSYFVMCLLKSFPPISTGMPLYYHTAGEYKTAYKPFVSYVCYKHFNHCVHYYIFYPRCLKFVQLFVRV